jgi:hypothetical protein
MPFDVTLAGNNEYGAATAMRIFGVEILNEGGGISIDDAVSEMQATFVARYVQPWGAGRLGLFPVRRGKTLARGRPTGAPWPREWPLATFAPGRLSSASRGHR